MIVGVEDIGIKPPLRRVISFDQQLSGYKRELQQPPIGSEHPR
jgi:hypothetical protein